MVLGELDTFGDLGVEVLLHLLQLLLLEGVHISVVVDFLHAILAQLDRRSEELRRAHLTVDVGAFDDSLFAAEALEHLFCELPASEGHGEGSGASTCLGGHNFVPTKHDAVGELFLVVLAELGALDLRQQGKNGDAGVATNDLFVPRKEDKKKRLVANKLKTE